MATIPGCAPMRINDAEANALGDAWATYIDSLPSGRKNQVLKTVESIMPGLVCLGTTAFVFGPRIQTIRSGARAPGRERIDPGVSYSVDPPIVVPRTHGPVPDPAAPRAPGSSSRTDLFSGDADE